MYQLNYTIKQHTPIIHFQHNEAGATLRASEIKPKLDRFIIELMGADALKKEWFNNIEKGSLDYQLKILAPESVTKFIIANRMSTGRPGQREVLNEHGWECIDFSAYFAQEKEIGGLFRNNHIRENDRLISSFSLVDDFEKRVTKLKTLGLFAEGDIHLRINTQHIGLMGVIEEHLAPFFVNHNFGTRQTKGFGCFLPKSISDVEILCYLKLSKNVTGIFKKASTISFEGKLKFINEHYTRLKRGESFNDYRKSLLWEYMCNNKKLNWEKRKIKLHIKENSSALFARLKCDHRKPIHRSGHFIDSCKNDNSYYYIRALLGLAEQYEFATPDANERIKVKVQDTLKYDTDSANKLKAIDRFASPIRYMVSDTSVFVVTTKIPEELYLSTNEDGVKNKRFFRFSIDALPLNKHFDLPLPPSFDLEDFIKNKGGLGANLKNQ